MIFGKGATVGDSPGCPQVLPFLGRLGMTINYSKPHLSANTMSCALFDSRDSSAAFRLSPARGVAITSMLRIKNAADSS